MTVTSRLHYSTYINQMRHGFRWRDVSYVALVALSFLTVWGLCQFCMNSWWRNFVLWRQIFSAYWQQFSPYIQKCMWFHMHLAKRDR